MLHHGEEPPVSGTRGSGTIFFSGCGMKCVYCQNHVFSQSVTGKEVSAEELADIMLGLQCSGAHNINLVNPTFFVHVIIKALRYAFLSGLKVPIVYNTGGYDSIEVLKLLEGLVDIYLPDMRYSDDRMAEKYSGVKGYVKVNRAAVKEMCRQTGFLEVNEGGAVKGVIIRLLVLPSGVSGTCDTLDFIAKNFAESAAVSLMSQYYPAYKASEFPDIARKVNSDEYKEAIKKLEDSGIIRGWKQPYESDFDEKFLGENFNSEF
jgi:putative pyruvate formate lyase activating enzyme